MDKQWEPSTWQQPVQDIVKEYEQHEADEMHIEEQTEPDQISRSMVRRGVLDVNTGMLKDYSKAHKVTTDNVRGYTPQGKKNYERIFGHA